MLGALVSFLRSRWELLLVLVVFIAFTLPHLDYPFYCDESWVYAPAVKTMAVRGPSLLPGAIPDGLSRGHPLFFHFACALWIRCFGASNVAVHAFPWLVSLLCLVAVYECCRRLFDRRAGTAALVLWATQVIFFVQAGAVLPEIMLAMLTLLSLYYYSRGRFAATAIVLFMLFFTKENGTIFGAVLGIDALVMFFCGGGSVGRRLARIAAVAVPVLLIGGFFLLQKARMGWYLLPEHSGLIHTGWDACYMSFREALYFTFRGDHGNPALVVLLLLLSVIPAVKNKNIRYLFLLLPAAIVYVLTNKWITEHTGDVLWVVLFALFFGAAAYWLISLGDYPRQTRKFIILLVLCFVAHICFLSFSVPAYRYLMVNILLSVVFIGAFVGVIARAGGNGIFYAAVACILLAGGYSFYMDENNSDADLEGFHSMRVQQRTVAYLEQQQAWDRPVSIGCYWALCHYNDTMAGYLGSSRVFTKASHGPADSADYVVVDNICGEGDRARVAADSSFRLVYSIHDHASWAEVYRHIRK